MREGAQQRHIIYPFRAQAHLYQQHSFTSALAHSATHVPYCHFYATLAENCMRRLVNLRLCSSTIVGLHFHLLHNVWSAGSHTCNWHCSRTSQELDKISPCLQKFLQVESMNSNSHVKFLIEMWNYLAWPVICHNLCNSTLPQLQLLHWDHLVFKWDLMHSKESLCEIINWRIKPVI